MAKANGVVSERKRLKKKAQKMNPGREMEWIGGILMFKDNPSGYFFHDLVPNIPKVPKSGKIAGGRESARQPKSPRMYFHDYSPRQYEKSKKSKKPRQQSWRSHEDRWD